MEPQPLSVQLKRLEAEVRQILRPVDVPSLASKQRDLISDLQQSLVDAKIYIQTYGLSETGEEQAANAKAAKKWLALARRHILGASEYNIFSAVNVAQLTAQIEKMIGEL